MALSGWNTINIIKISIDDELIGSDLTDYTVVVRIGASVGKTSLDNTAIFDELGANSHKIAVEVGGSGNQCYVEIEQWDHVNEVATLHVKVPSVLAAEDTTLYLYYDPDHADNNEYVYDAADLAAPGGGSYVFNSFTSFGQQDERDRRILIATSKLGSFVGTGKVRVQFSGDRSDAWEVVSCYIGLPASSGDAYDFDGNQVKVTFNGGESSGLVPKSGVLWSDWIDFEVDGTSNVIVAFYHEVIAKINLASAPVGITAYYKYSTANESHVSDVSGYTSGNLRGWSGIQEISGAALYAAVDGNTSFACRMAQDPSESAPQMLESSRYMANGTSAGTMTSGDLVDGVVGPALDFDGTDDYTNHGYKAAHDLTDTLTVEAIIKPSATLDNGLSNPVGIVSRRNDPTDSESTWALVINADGKLALLTGAGSVVGTKASWTSGTAYHVVATYDSTGPAAELWVDGVKEILTVDSPAAMTGSVNSLVIGKDADSGEFFPGVIDNVVVASTVRSDAWIIAQAHNVSDGLITYETITSPHIISFLVQSYGTGPIWQELEQTYGIKLGASLEQMYSILWPLQSVLEQSWGLRLFGTLLQPYGNAPVIQSELWQWYGDTTDVQSWISQRWGDAHQAQSVLEQVYNLPQALQSVLEQRYAITGTEVLSYIEQLYNLHGYDAVRAALVQPWMIAAAESLRAAVSATVTVGGTVVDPYHITVEWSADMYALSGELHFADQGTWLGIAEGDAVEVACAGQTAALIVAGKRRSRMPGQAVYIVELESAATLLDQPHALPLLERWDGELASTVAQELADYAGITVDWQIIDDYVYDLYANNETPLAVLQKLAGEWGGVLRCELDGTLSVVYDYPYPPAPAPGDTWETVSPAATLTDQDNFFTAEESLDRRPGYNKYLIGNQDAATAGERLEEETVSASRKYLRGYVVPWADQALYSLATSKDGVAIQALAVPAADYLVEEELVEFVNGGGRTSYPVHAITSYTWQDDQLGAITHSESGELTAEVEGNSLLLLTYETRFLLWQADYPQIADVQFILERGE